MHCKFKRFVAHKMTVFPVIFEVNSSIGKLWGLLGHFDKKGMSSC